MSITGGTLAGSARRLLTALFIVLVASLAMGPGLASADESDVESDSPVLLEPGYNFVGWIAESMAVGDLFEAIPEIEIVWYWDAAERYWRWAAPAAPARLWTLDAINPGMAVLVWNGSEESVPWVAQTEPAFGRIELHQGTNWVSWAGPSGWSIEDVARGIGRSLLHIEVGEHDSRTSRSPEEVQSRTILRGDPIVVEVARDVPWLQPTGSLPKISFFGDFSEERQAYYTDIVREVVDYSGITFGVEADPTALEMWIFKDEVLDSAELSNEVREVLAYHVSRGIATGSGKRVVFPVGDSPLLTGREVYASVMLHEYFHAVQQQLSGKNYSAPIWIVEGHAQWMEYKYNFTGPANPWEFHTASEAGICGHVTLQAAQHSTFGCEYPLGVLAAKFLDESVGVEHLVEFWRQMVPRAIGPNGSWEAASRWEDAFGLAFGLPLEEFYDRYGAQRSSPGPRVDFYGRDPSVTTFVEGHVRGDGGEGVAGVRVALTQSSGVQAGYVSNAVTDAEGNFVVQVFAGERQRIQVFPLDGCGYWVGESSDPVSREDGREFTFDNSSQSPLNLPFHADLCKRVEGTVVSPEFGPLAGVQVWITGIDNEWLQSQRASSDGGFTLTVPREGWYRIGVNLSGDCSVYYQRAEPAGAWHEATSVRVSDSDISDLHV